MPHFFIKKSSCKLHTKPRRQLTVDSFLFILERCLEWARSIRLMTCTPSLLYLQCTSSTELSPSSQMDMDLRMRWAGRERKKKRYPSATPSLLSVLSFSSHSLPLNHRTLLRGSGVYRRLCSLCPSVPPFRSLYSTVLVSHSLCPASAPHVLLKDAADGAEEEGGEKILVTREHTRMKPFEPSREKEM